MDLNTSLSTIDFKLLPEQVNFYCEVNVNSICRVCLEKNNNSNKRMCNIFEGNQPLFTMMMSCASVQIIQGDGLPNSICSKCLTKLNIAWHFKNQCETSENRLKEYYSNNSSQIQVQEVSFDPIKEEVKSLLYNETANELGLVNFQNTTLYSNDQAQKNNASNLDKQKNPKKTKQKLDKQKESKIHQCDTCGKIFNRREYLTQHIRIHTGEKPYRCHLCEKRFVNSGHLTTHMRTHTGEKPHNCSLCPKAFSTRQELHKHTMVHNGERPFVCTSCDKRFGSSSNLYSHLRHHTGEKNFTCEHCGKAFYTKQELKQHMVVHTGVKAFLCEICNKRFSQIAHLRRHSKTHL